MYKVKHICIFLNYHIQNQLNGLNPSERLENSPQHFFGDVKVQRTDVEAHRAFVRFVDEAFLNLSIAILFRLTRLNNHGNAEKLLSVKTEGLQNQFNIISLNWFNSIIVLFHHTDR